MRLTVESAGIETTHQKDFCHVLPGGFPRWVFLQLVTPHLINESDSTPVLADPGTCVLYTPGHPRFLYCAPDRDELQNNFIHFASDDNEAVSCLVQSCGIPTNRFFRLRDSAPALHSLREIIYEQSVAQPHQEEMIHHLICMLLLHIGRGCVPWDAETDPVRIRNYRILEKLRKSVYASPEREWNVAEMAASVYLSENRFILLYRRFFQTTPRQDLIRARIQKAKYMMTSSASMRDVALSCGFKNEFYFSSAFKRMEGIAPSVYAQSARTENLQEA